MGWWWFVVVMIRAVSPAPDDQWAARLTELDLARAQAFATADPQRLDEVYVSGSPARRTDAASIDAYARRGGRVVGAELRILTCHVVRASPDRVRLEVVDQLGPARVLWSDGTSRDLPRDHPSRREITVVRTPAGWRIAQSRQVSPSPEAGDAPHR